jgi:hypothetical protein
MLKWCVYLIERMCPLAKLEANGDEADATPSWASEKIVFCNKKVNAATSAAATLIHLQSASASLGKESKRTRPQCAAVKEFDRAVFQKDNGDVEVEDADAHVNLYAHDVGERYADWITNLEKAEKTPYDAQWKVIETIHHQCCAESAYENSYADAAEACPSNLFRLIHGLPGSGKTQLMLWLRDYFEKVWSWEAGVHFVFLAPLNTMAANIGGSTVHSFGEIRFKDKRGNTIQSRGGTNDEVSSMSIKCRSLRFAFVDEIEATGTDVLADLEENVQRHAPKRFRTDAGAVLPRSWGGVNFFLFGDWWQLPSVGGICIMSNPFSEKAMESAKVSHILNMFWDKDSQYSVQRWPESNKRVLCLEQNKRSGADAWFSELLTNCREGDMTEDQYNFLHGLPTKVCGSWLSRDQRSMCGNGECDRFYDNASSILSDYSRPWQVRWEEAKQMECAKCAEERQRRKRVIGCGAYGGLKDAEAAAILASVRFSRSLLITEFNKPVSLYALLRSKDFARITGTAPMTWYLQP